MNWMVNYIWLAWNLACMLRIYRIYNSTVGFSKYEFNNKLLSDVTLLRVTPTNSFNWIQILTNPLLDYIIFIYSLCLQNFKVIEDQ